MSEQVKPAQRWSSETYEKHARFVSVLGEPLVELLNPRPAEKILDLGCGDGALTERIAATGAQVTGVDASIEFVEAARARGIDARVMDAQSLKFESGFDGVFSNAAMHWMPDADAVIQGVRRALCSGGRFAAEFGGHGNIAAITTACRAVLARHGLAFEMPWYFPSPDEYSQRLIRHGFRVQYIDLIPRPVILPTSMEDWLETFGAGVPASLRSEVTELLRPALCDQSGRWTADYVRLRFLAQAI